MTAICSNDTQAAQAKQSLLLRGSMKPRECLQHDHRRRFSLQCCIASCKQGLHPARPNQYTCLKFYCASGKTQHPVHIALTQIGIITGYSAQKVGFTSHSFCFLLWEASFQELLQREVARFGEQGLRAAVPAFACKALSSFAQSCQSDFVADTSDQISIGIETNSD